MVACFVVIVAGAYQGKKIVDQLKAEENGKRVEAELKAMGLGEEGQLEAMAELTKHSSHHHHGHHHHHHHHHHDAEKQQQQQQQQQQQGKDVEAGAEAGADADVRGA